MESVLKFGLFSSVRTEQCRLRSLIDAHAQDVYRTLRRMGVSDNAIEDAWQKVFLTASGKLDDMQEGKEKAFLIGIAIHIAAHARRKMARTKEDLGPPSVEHKDPMPLPDEQIEKSQLQSLLTNMLNRMPEDLRMTFILFELEDMTLSEIAELLEIPQGTVASRLRRARESFRAMAEPFRAQWEGKP